MLQRLRVLRAGLYAGSVAPAVTVGVDMLHACEIMCLRLHNLAIDGSALSSQTEQSDPQPDADTTPDPGQGNYAAT